MSHTGDTKNIFAVTDCPSDETLMLYVQQMLSKEKLRAVELHLVDCEMCSDFVEGIRIAGNVTTFKNDVAEINRAVEKKITPEDTKIIPISRSTKYAIAATILLLLTTGFFFNHYFEKVKTDTVAVLEIPKPSVEKQESEQEPSVASIEKPINPGVVSKNNAKVFERKKVALPPIESRISEAKDISTNYVVAEKYKSTDANFSMGKAVFEQPAAGAIAEERETITTDEDITKPTADSKGDASVNQSKIAAKSTVSQTSAAPASPSYANEENDKKAIALETTSKTVDTKIPTLAEAKNDFNSKKNASAKIKLEKIVRADSTNLEAVFYLAKTQRELKQFSKSTSYFNTILQSTSSNFYAEAQWLKALNLLDLNKINEAKILLQQVVNANGVFANNAAEKLKLLK